MKRNKSIQDQAAAWQRVAGFAEKLSPAGARTLLKVQFSEQDIVRMNELGAKACAGALTPEEQLDLDNYERLGCLLDILHAKARIVLRPRRTAS
jgi:hypothetical protein